MGRNIASRGRSARGARAVFNLLFASRIGWSHKRRTARFMEASGLGMSAQAGGRFSQRGERLDGLHLRSDDRNAVRDRREAVVRHLDDQFAGLRGLGNGGVERLLAVFGIELEEVGRRLDGGVALQRGGRVFKALASEGHAFLAQNFHVLGSDLAGFDHRFDVRLVEFDGFFGQLAGLAHRFLGLLVEVGGQGFGAGLRFVGELLDGVVHGLDSFAGGGNRLRCGLGGKLGGNFLHGRLLGGDLLGNCLGSSSLFRGRLGFCLNRLDLGRGRGLHRCGGSDNGRGSRSFHRLGGGFQRRGFESLFGTIHLGSHG